MNEPSFDHALVDEDPTLDKALRLEELVDRAALGELCQSFRALFGISVRVLSDSGMLLADTGGEQELCAHLGTFPEGRRRCSDTVQKARSREPGDSGDVMHPCFTGAAYRIVAIEYDGRRIGRLVVGPYLPGDVNDVPGTLLEAEPGLDRSRAKSLLMKMPRAKADTVTRITAHLKAALDLILFSGHKALLTSQMHLASVKEGYRQLEEKTEKLQEAYDRLKELDRLKSNFLATVSHELRTPLTSILGYSEMLREGLAGALGAEQLEFVGTIHEKGEQLLGLITSLLDLSKLESGTMSLRSQSVRLSQVLDQVRTTVTPTARKKGVQVKVEVEEPLSPMRGDPERLRQVFINLVDNALKFTPEGGTVSMTARLADANDEEGDGFVVLAPVRANIEVRVADTGIGIPPAERSRVFDAFYQVDSSSTREYGGTGLGLSIVKRLVDAHGGTIHIEGNEPRGAVFVVTFPPAAPTAPPPEL